MSEEAVSDAQDVPADSKTINFTLNLDRLRGRITNTLGEIIERVSIAIHSLDRAPDGEVFLDDVAYRVLVNSEPVLTNKSRINTRGWLLSVGLRDGIEGLLGFLQEIRFIAGLIRRQHASGPIEIKVAGTITEVFERVKREELGKFDYLPLRERLSQISQTVECDVPFQTELLSINQARNCLTHRGGVIGAEDVKEDPFHKTLIVRYLAPELIYIDSTGMEEVLKPGSIVRAGEVELRHQNTPRVKNFELGSRVDFSTQEFFDIVETMRLIGATFVDRLVQRSQELGLWRDLSATKSS